ncbi:MAG: antibiotic biosynthesis monooxygenase family protein [Nitrososphaeraceae archaeon]
MVKIVESDNKVPLSAQLEEDVGPVILMNKFNVGPDEVDEFLKVFEETTKYFKQQPGFISAQLHRGIAGSTTFFNYVIWESAAQFKRAFDNPDFKSNMANTLPTTVMSPHLYKKVAIPGICVE